MFKSALRCKFGTHDVMVTQLEQISKKLRIGKGVDTVAARPEADTTAYRIAPTNGIEYIAGYDRIEVCLSRVSQFDSDWPELRIKPGFIGESRLPLVADIIGGSVRSCSWSEPSMRETRSWPVSKRMERSRRRRDRSSVLMTGMQILLMHAVKDDLERCPHRCVLNREYQGGHQCSKNIDPAIRR